MPILVVPGLGIPIRTGGTARTPLSPLGFGALKNSKSVFFKKRYFKLIFPFLEQGFFYLEKKMILTVPKTVGRNTSIPKVLKLDNIFNILSKTELDRGNSPPFIP